MKYTFMAAHETQFRVQRMCRVLQVQRSGYYAWRHRTQSTRAQANQALLALIETEHQNSRKTYGPCGPVCTSSCGARGWCVGTTGWRA